MELQIAGTNTELTPVVQRYIERKLGKLNRHLRDIIEIKVEISEEKTKSPGQHYLVRVMVTGEGGGAVFHGEERGEDTFQAVDRVITVLTRQFEHHKGKLHKKGRGVSLRDEPNEPAGPVEPAARVVKVKRFAVKPMSVDEAIEQMEILGHSFFLFYDADAKKVKLLYRRNDGNLGLIEPDIG
jgi:putative sigma-54 modulation protein